MDLNIKSLLKKIRRQSRFGACNVKIKLHAKSYFGAGNQGCGSGLILTGSGSDLSGQTGSGSGIHGQSGLNMMLLPSKLFVQPITNNTSMLFDTLDTYLYDAYQSPKC